MYYQLARLKCFDLFTEIPPQYLDNEYKLVFDSWLGRDDFEVVVQLEVFDPNEVFMDDWVRVTPILVKDPRTGDWVEPTTIYSEEEFQDLTDLCQDSIKSNREFLINVDNYCPPRY